MNQPDALFRTVARSDRFGFGAGETLDGRKVELQSLVPSRLPGKVYTRAQ